MAEPFAPTVRQESERNWTSIIIGLVAVLIVVGIIVATTRSKPTTGGVIDPYAARLQLSGLKLSAAENYVGGTVTYLDLNISNTGNQTLVGAQMKAVFRNS